MTEYKNKLHFTSGTTTQTASVFSTIAEIGTDYVPVSIDGTTYYAILGSTSDSRATSGRVKKDGTDYAIISRWGDKTILVQRTSGVWYDQVSGQGETSAAYSAGWSVLNNNAIGSGPFVNISGSEYTGRDISYKRTVYHCFRIYSYYQHPSLNISVGFVTTDGGNGTVEWSGLRTHSQFHKDFVICGHGGDKGHYGEGRVTINVSAPGIDTISYTGTFWIDSD